jgi:hypothetical protein
VLSEAKRSPHKAAAAQHLAFPAEDNAMDCGSSESQKWNGPINPSLIGRINRRADALPTHDGRTASGFGTVPLNRNVLLSHERKSAVPQRSTQRTDRPL